MRRLITALTITIVTAFMVVLPVTPANADTGCTLSLGTWCGSIRHGTSGLHVPIPVICNHDDLLTWSVARGETSKQYCGNDTEAAFVSRGQEIWCLHHGPITSWWYKKWDATGWHGISNGSALRCIVRRD